jgi:tricorn protease
MRALRTAPFLAMLLVAVPATAAPGYLGQPDIHGEHVVLVAEGDLWIAPVAGGLARRLTTDVGTETAPRFSPDGRSIAFTGSYDGNADVFVVPIEGGEPRRLTWHPASDQVVGWSTDGERVYFGSAREQPHGSREMFEVPAKGGDAIKLPLGWVNTLDESPTDGRWAFTRNGGGGIWKRYRGGSADKIWVGHPERADFREVTGFEGMNAYPMWNGGRIYYLSDEGGTANLWSMAADGSDRKRHTDFEDWDARSPAMGPDGRIVFSLAGDVHVFDPRSGSARRVDVELPSDRVLTRSRYPDAGQYVTWIELSPDGERLVVAARGELFSVPVKKGLTLPLTHGSGARESYGSFDPEGKRIVYVTDEPREEEIRTIDAWGRGEPEVLRPAGKSGWHFAPIWSPSGEHVAYADETQRLYVTPAKGGKPEVVDHATTSPITQYAWSPDGRYLAYAKNAVTDYASIWIWDTKDRERHRVTGDDTDDVSPAWDPSGRYLYFLSHRYTNPLLDVRDLENVNIKPTRPYAVLLRPDVDPPFADRAGLPPSDADEKKKEDEDDAAGDKKKKDDDGKDDDGEDEKPKKPEPVVIDFDGLSERVVPFPVDPGQYASLGATKSRVFWVSFPLQGMAEWGPLFGPSAPNGTLTAFVLETKKTETFAEGIGGYTLAAASDKLAFVKGPGEIYVVGSEAPPSDVSEARVALDGVVVEVDPREEWAQIYHETWRQMRDFYWDAGMAGVDWAALRDQYATMLPRLATRADLQDLLMELIGEMSTSHTYVMGGDPGRSAQSRATGLLGADLVRSGQAFRVERIYRGAPADGERSPLLEPGVGVREGDYVLAVNHRPFPADLPFDAALEGRAEQPVLLTVNGSPSRTGARDVLVRPLANDSGLRYADWVRRNREEVARRTDGKIGYLHVPNMMSEGLIEFNTWFYPQLDREGMVVDVRWNGGGFVSQMLVERLRRDVLSFNRARAGDVDTYPYRVLNGPFVVITNEQAGSDGDIFPAAVQLEGLAPVIGMRSWGGVVGISSIRPLVDGGIPTQPSSAWWDPRTGWGMENRGVEPDIEVQNLPQELGRGVDRQLERAIEEVMRLHREDPPKRPDFGPVRPRGRQHYRDEAASRVGR